MLPSIWFYSSHLVRWAICVPQAPCTLYGFDKFFYVELCWTLSTSSSNSGIFWVFSSWRSHAAIAVGCSDPWLTIGLSGIDGWEDTILTSLLPSAVSRKALSQAGIARYSVFFAAMFSQKVTDWRIRGEKVEQRSTFYESKYFAAKFAIMILCMLIWVRIRFAWQISSSGNHMYMHIVQTIEQREENGSK